MLKTVSWRELVNGIFLVLVTLTIFFKLSGWVSFDNLGIVKLVLVAIPLISLIFSAYLFSGFFKEPKEGKGGRLSWKW